MYNGITHWNLHQFVLFDITRSHQNIHKGCAVQHNVSTLASIIQPESSCNCKHTTISRVACYLAEHLNKTRFWKQSNSIVYGMRKLGRATRADYRCHAIITKAHANGLYFHLEIGAVRHYPNSCTKSTNALGTAHAWRSYNYPKSSTNRWTDCQV